MYVYALSRCLVSTKDGSYVVSFVTRFMDDCESSSVCWELNSFLLQEQQVLFNTLSPDVIFKNFDSSVVHCILTTVSPPSTPSQSSLPDQLVWLPLSNTRAVFTGISTEHSLDTIRLSINSYIMAGQHNPVGGNWSQAQKKRVRDTSTSIVGSTTRTLSYKTIRHM